MSTFFCRPLSRSSIRRSHESTIHFLPECFYHDTCSCHLDYRSNEPPTLCDFECCSKPLSSPEDRRHLGESRVLHRSFIVLSILRLLAPLPEDDILVPAVSS